MPSYSSTLVFIFIQHFFINFIVPKLCDKCLPTQLSLSSSAELKNAWSYTSSSHTSSWAQRQLYLSPYGLSEAESVYCLSTDKYEIYLMNVTRLVSTAVPEDGDRDSFRNVVHLFLHIL
jgi:hypothetical protein